MEVTTREFWTLMHGMGFGAAYLLAFAGGLAGLYSLRPQLVTAEGISERTQRLRWGIGLMALIPPCRAKNWPAIRATICWRRRTPPNGTSSA
jgi:hypothetical protein